MTLNRWLREGLLSGGIRRDASTSASRMSHPAGTPTFCGLMIHGKELGESWRLFPPRRLALGLLRPRHAEPKSIAREDVELLWTTWVRQNWQLPSASVGRFGSHSAHRLIHSNQRGWCGCLPGPHEWGHQRGRLQFRSTPNARRIPRIEQFWWSAGGSAGGCLTGIAGTFFSN